MSISSNSASAQDYKSALGIRLSSNPAVVNNSISFKYFLSMKKPPLKGYYHFSGLTSLGALYEIHKPINVPGLKWFMVAVAMLASVDLNTGVPWALSDLTTNSRTSS